jgi:hypothetical protein
MVTPRKHELEFVAKSMGSNRLGVPPRGRKKNRWTITGPAITPRTTSSNDVRPNQLKLDLGLIKS